ncbi:MAG: HAMP domain-containing sensor histidine kinase, partial [bacterium]
LNLYSLFVIPVFLMAITYSIFRLDIFNVKMVSTYFLVFGFLILTGVQLIFVNDSVDQLLTTITLFLSISIAYLLFRNLKRESDQRIQIEKLNVDLEKLIQQRESLVHLITHKVKGSFTHSKYIFAGLIDGMFGAITPETKKIAQFGIDSDDAGIKTVDLILNASNLQKGIVKFDLKPVSFREVILKTIEDKKEVIQQKGLLLEINIGEEDFKIDGDIFWLKEVSNNLIDNALYYTKTGKIIVGLEKKMDKIIFSVKDTGVGINKEDRKNLFTEGGRGKESIKTNVNSTGYGLYSVKLIVEAHKGRVWMESEGEGKGSQFFVEFKAI